MNHRQGHNSPSTRDVTNLIWSLDRNHLCSTMRWTTIACCSKGKEREDREERTKKSLEAVLNCLKVLLSKILVRSPLHGKMERFSQWLQLRYFQTAYFDSIVYQAGRALDAGILFHGLLLKSSPIALLRWVWDSGKGGDVPNLRSRSLEVSKQL